MTSKHTALILLGLVVIVQSVTIFNLYYRLDSIERKVSSLERSKTSLNKRILNLENLSLKDALNK